MTHKKKILLAGLIAMPLALMSTPSEASRNHNRHCVNNARVVHASPRVVLNRGFYHPGNNFFFAWQQPRYVVRHYNTPRRNFNKNARIRNSRSNRRHR